MSSTLLKIRLVGVSVVVVSILSAFPVFAWTGPTGTAPNNNVSVPVNIGATAQTKVGAFIATPPANTNAVTGTGSGASWGGYFTGVNGVYGSGTSGNGVQGASTGGSGGNFTGTYGVYAVGTSYAGYFAGQGSGAGGVYGQNGQGTGGYLAYPGSTWGLYTPQYAYASDMLIGATGKWISQMGTGLPAGTVLVPFGGMYSNNWYAGGVCDVGNPWTGGCSCPSWAPAGGGISFNGDDLARSLYYCYNNALYF